MPSNRPTSVLTPTMFYQQALDAGDYQPDAVQRQTVEALTVIQQALIERERSTPVAESRGLRGRLQSLLGKPAAKPQEPVQGLYMWGGVGRGKTWLMDLFFHSIPSERKLR
ncbi:MAG: cell division protein ZapE, partial [Enterobacterales bacterium]|nr:cell division protein ZapE [Enterobacterales bacterium]